MPQGAVYNTLHFKDTVSSIKQVKVFTALPKFLEHRFMMK